ncbi:hypothetical protein RIF29_37774 [Crotalaria pallida]|uniref:Uncharacterized protein n=1 Tax=Crotalaria pallida TaxID=3830 RepID=A0AAN9E4E6_CROPI
MAAASSSLDLSPSPSPPLLNLNQKEGTGVMMCSSPLFSPSSDKSFWSTLRTRIDTLLDHHPQLLSNLEQQQLLSTTTTHIYKNEQSNRLKEDSMLLIRGFDSVAHTLSLLSSNLDNALQGARELAQPPTLTDIFHSKFDKAENKVEEGSRKGENEKEKEESKQGVKRKFDHNDISEENGNDSQMENGPKEQDRNIKRAKNLAVSMATRAASLARELKSLKSDLCFMQERCGLLEEENRRLRDGFAKGVRPEEDDLVRLQLEALLAEKSRLASENANLVRENQCLNQLVEYHQLASQDLSESYEHVIQGMCLDFTSPPPPTHTIAQEDDVDDDDDLKTREPQTILLPRTDLSTSLAQDDDVDDDDDLKTREPQTILLPRTDLSTSLDECCHGEEEEEE